MGFPIHVTTRASQNCCHLVLKPSAVANQKLNVRCSMTDIWIGWCGANFFVTIIFSLVYKVMLSILIELNTVSGIGLCLISIKNLIARIKITQENQHCKILCSLYYVPCFFL
ncbi:unnamed protein product [Chrysodeixis includens]|uniref:Uncharacterized protein n=1 Tax=Chrysodeixis includens TaxID=689277 RepID=A0A9N8KR57_CHRIL|nr:unnamed protein product [Chrysodeixis includens]